MYSLIVVWSAVAWVILIGFCASVTLGFLIASETVRCNFDYENYVASKNKLRHATYSAYAPLVIADIALPLWLTLTLATIFFIYLATAIIRLDKFKLNHIDLK